MAKRRKSNRKRSNKGMRKKEISISGHTFPHASGHIITARAYGTNVRFVIMLVATFLLLMVFMSFSAIFTAPANPAVWATLVFFGGLLGLLLIHEENIFPSISRQKKIWAIAAWFIAFVISPYIIFFAQTFNFTVFVLIIVFLVILTPIIARLVFSDERWMQAKGSIKNKMHVPNLKKKKQVKPKGKSNELRGINRKKKIYRR